MGTLPRLEDASLVGSRPHGHERGGWNNAGERQSEVKWNLSTRASGPAPKSKGVAEPNSDTPRSASCAAAASREMAPLVDNVNGWRWTLATSVREGACRGQVRDSLNPHALLGTQPRGRLAFGLAGGGAEDPENQRSLPDFGRGWQPRRVEPITPSARGGRTHTCHSPGPDPADRSPVWRLRLCRLMQLNPRRITATCPI
jgi:hypothetical protein